MNAGLIAFGVDCFNGAITGKVAATMGTRGSSETASGPLVMQSPAIAFNARQDPINGPINGPIDCDGATNGVMVPSMRVRRLTPRECERLQGFQDDYTLIPWRGGLASDSVRYKAIGNSWAINCARWVGRRIALVDSIQTL